MFDEKLSWKKPILDKKLPPDKIDSSLLAFEMVQKKLVDSYHSSKGLEKTISY